MLPLGGNGPFGTLGNVFREIHYTFDVPPVSTARRGKSSGPQCLSSQVVTKLSVARLAHACSATFQMLLIQSEAGRRARAFNLGVIHAPRVFATPEVGPSCVNEKHTSFYFLVYYQLSNFQKQQHRWHFKCHRVVFYPLIEGKTRAGGIKASVLPSARS